MLRYAKLCGCAGLMALAVGCSSAPSVPPADGTYKAIEDINNSDLPMPAAK